AVSLASEASGDGGEVMALAAADLEDGVGRREGEQADHGVDQRCLDAARDKPPARFRGGDGIARPGRAPILYLQEVDVTAAGAVERMPTATGQATSVARERQATAPHRAEKNDHGRQSRMAGARDVYGSLTRR